MNGLGGREGLLRGAPSLSSPSVTATTTTATGGSITVLYTHFHPFPSHARAEGRHGGE